MTTRTIRVTVRGAFDGLTADQRAELLARQAEHDPLHHKGLKAHAEDLSQAPVGARARRAAR